MSGHNFSHSSTGETLLIGLKELVIAGKSPVSRLCIGTLCFLVLRGYLGTYSRT